MTVSTGRKKHPGTSASALAAFLMLLALSGACSAFAGEIHGVKWDDLDGNGLKDAGEAGLPNWKIYLDSDENGQWDSGEPYAMTDADGIYAFTGLSAGAYIVGEEAQAGWEQSFPGATPLMAPMARKAVPPVSTTRSRAPAYLYGSVAGFEPLSNVSMPLINMTAFRADGRFSGITGAGFAAVVLDTGVDLNHPFFGPDADGDGVADRIVYQQDFADGDMDASDADGHGSNVTSIAASQDATYGGAAPGANIIALKVFPSSGGSGSFGDIESALQWIVANAATYDIASVNMSLGDGGNYATPQSLYGIGDEMAALEAMDVFVVSAAGNAFYGKNSVPGVAYPAADANSLAIGAVWDGNNGGPWRWSSGAIDYSSGADRVVSFSQRHQTMTDIFAPGAMITGAGTSGGTITFAGTSQASPHIAGVAVLAQQLAVQRLGRRLTLAEFRGLLASTGVSIVDGDDEDDNVINTGITFKRVDMLALGNAIWNMAASYPGMHTVTLGAGDVLTEINFGNRRVEVTLDVQSAPITGLAVTSTTGHGGTTDYSRILTPGTSVDLQAPATDPAGYGFVKWTVNGIDEPAGRKSVIFNMPAANAAAVAVYVSESADLTDTELILSPAPDGWGQDFEVHYTVANLGTGNAGAFRVGFYLSEDASFDPGADVLLDSISYGGLAGGGTISELLALWLPAASPFARTSGTFHIVKVVDDENAVAESNELNNSDSASFEVPEPPGAGLRGEYFHDMALSELALTRIDPVVNFTWPRGVSPDPSMDSETFSVRWSGWVKAEYSETYTFYTVSDDGVRLWVNGTPLVNNWTNHSATENKGTIALVAGQKYDIVMEYFDNTLDATAKLLWSSASRLKEVIPQERLYPAVSAADYYVSPDGSDLNPGTEAAPWATIGHGVGSLAAGDTLHVLEGDYSESVTISALRGEPDAPITIIGHNLPKITATGQDVFLVQADSAWLVLDGMELTGGSRSGVIVTRSTQVVIRNSVIHHNYTWGVQTCLADHVTVEGCELYGATTQHGIYFSTTDYPTARGNLIHDNPQCGIHINGDLSEGGDGMITGATIVGNVIHDCGWNGGAAINMDGGEQAFVANNLIYNNQAGGITSYSIDSLHGGSGNQFYFNTVYFAPAVGRYGLQLYAGSTNATLKNNILICGDVALEADEESLPGLESDYNIYVRHGSSTPIHAGGTYSLASWQAASGLDLHSLDLMPTFADLAGGDFQLAAGSYGIDGGTPIAAIDYDITGDPREQGQAPDIGAYESSPAAPPPPIDGTGLQGEYFHDMALSQPALTRIDPTVDFFWPRGTSPDPSMDGETFSVRWTGRVKPLYSETYAFYTVSDDGVRLWVNGAQLVNNWTNHGSTENSGSIALSAGQGYDIVMEYYDNTLDATAKLLWSSASQTKQVIPRVCLYPPTPPCVFVLEADSVKIPEGGTGTVRVKLSAEPLDDVGADEAWLAGHDVDMGVVSGDPLAIAQADWDQWHEIVISAAEDADHVSGTATLEIRQTSGSSVIPNAQVTLIEQENDIVFVVEADPVIVPEGGTGTVRVKLSAEPLTDVGVDEAWLLGYDANLGIVSGNPLTIAQADWDLWHGIVVSAAEDVDTVNGTGTLEIRQTSGSSAVANATVELIEADNDVPYTLTVNSGTGDGDYPPGTVVPISADAPPADREFDRWTGDVGSVAVVTAASTTITMPASNITVTATYRDNAGTGLQGDYFHDMGLSQPALTRIDPTVNFTWPRGTPPDPSINEETFSVRWTGQVKALYSETYTFYTVSDDGVRLWVNGAPLVNNWTNHGATENSGSIALSAGQQYDIVMEYYDNLYDATAKLLWSSASQAKQVIPQACLYPPGPPPPPPTGPEIDITGNGLSISSGDTSPRAEDGTDFGSALAGSETVEHTFIVANAGNADLTFLNPPNPKISGPNASEFIVTQDVAGPLGSGAATPFKVGFAPTGLGLRQASLTIESDDDDEGSYTFSVQGIGHDGTNGTGLLGEYFHDMGLSQPALTRIDPTVNFTWPRGTSPDPSMDEETFSVRWSGQVKALYSETYTFYTVSDDGARLWVNGQQLVNNWTNHSATENIGSIALAAGQRYNIVMEYFDNTKDATAKLLWSSPGQAKEVIPEACLYPE